MNVDPHDEKSQPPADVRHDIGRDDGRKTEAASELIAFASSQAQMDDRVIKDPSRPSSPTSEKAKKKQQKKRTWKKPKDKPKRPLSAYNIFFQHQRKLMLGDTPAADGDSKLAAESTSSGHEAPKKRRHRKTHGKVGFAEMAKVIASKWKNLDEEAKKEFDEQAEREKLRYHKELLAWKETRATKKEGADETGSADGKDEGMDIVRVQHNEPQESAGTRSAPQTPTSATSPIQQNQAPRQQRLVGSEEDMISSMMMEARRNFMARSATVFPPPTRREPPLQRLGCPSQFVRLADDGPRQQLASIERARASLLQYASAQEEAARNASLAAASAGALANASAETLAALGAGALAAQQAGAMERMGSAGAMERMGSAGAMERMGSAGAMERMGSAGAMERMGSAGAMERMGSAGAMERLGSAGAMERLGSAGALGAPGRGTMGPAGSSAAGVGSGLHHQNALRDLARYSLMHGSHPPPAGDPADPEYINMLSSIFGARFRDR